jgi:AcrR family transcriptional regulator
LYFLFASKAELFRAAATHVLQEDLTEVERILGESGSPIRDRLLDAFDQWAGRYIGPHSNDIAAVIEDNPDLLGRLTLEAPARFSELVTAAVQAALPNLEPQGAAAVAQTLNSASVGIKYQVADRTTYLAQLATAVDLLLR